MDLYLFFARTPAELLNQTRHSNREKGITQREIHSHLDYLAVDVELLSADTLSSSRMEFWPFG